MFKYNFTSVYRLTRQTQYLLIIFFFLLKLIYFIIYFYLKLVSQVHFVLFKSKVKINKCIVNLFIYCILVLSLERVLYSQTLAYKFSTCFRAALWTCCGRCCGHEGAALLFIWGQCEHSSAHADHGPRKYTGFHSNTHTHTQTLVQTFL